MPETLLERKDVYMGLRTFSCQRGHKLREPLFIDIDTGAVTRLRVRNPSREVLRHYLLASLRVEDTELCSFSVTSDEDMRLWARLMYSYMHNSARTPESILCTVTSLLTQRGGAYLEDQQMVMLKALFYRQGVVQEDHTEYSALSEILEIYLSRAMSRPETSMGRLCRMFALLNLLFYVPDRARLKLSQLSGYLPEILRDGFLYEAEELRCREDIKCKALQLVRELL